MNSETVQPKSLVSLAYTLSDTNGHVLEERTPENPLEYVQGTKQLLQAVEHVIEGQSAGFAASVHLRPQDAYGEYDMDLVAEMPRERFPNEIQLQVGMKFTTMGPMGDPMVVRIADIDEDTVVIDGNHPLAGVELVFSLRVLDVQNAYDAEIAEFERSDAEQEPVVEKAESVEKKPVIKTKSKMKTNLKKRKTEMH